MSSTENVAKTVLREAGPLDASVIAAMHVECFSDGIGGGVWSPAAIAKILSLPGSYGYLATAGTEPSGFVLARQVVEDMEIFSLGVRPAWRRCGVARALIYKAVERARLAGARRALLEVAEDNARARALYAAENFAVIARRPAYYRHASGAPATALVFERPIVS